MINQRTKRGALSGKVIRHEFTRVVSDKYADPGSAIRYGCIPLIWVHWNLARILKRSLRARYYREGFHALSLMAYECVSAVAGLQSHNGMRVLLRRRRVTYFTDVYILSALCSTLSQAHITLRTLSRESRRRSVASQRIIVPTSENRFLQSAASSRYRFTTDQYTNRRAMLTEYPQLADPVPLSPRRFQRVAPGLEM